MDFLEIAADIIILGTEVELSAIRSQGSGGQNVNKVATAIHLRFDIKKSSLPENLKQQLLSRSDHRITKDGVVIIKAQQSRSQEQNRLQALQQLQMLIRSALIVRKSRKKSRPSRGAIEKRIQQKKQRGSVKKLRQVVVD